MKYFESFLAEQMNAFLKYRSDMGYSEEYQLSILRMFDHYLKKVMPEPGPLSPEFFLTMRSSLKIDPVSVNSVICITRGFFNYMVRKGYYDKNPVRDVPFLRKNVVAPFIFSPQQTDRLLTALCLSALGRKFGDVFYAANFCSFSSLVSNFFRSSRVNFHSKGFETFSYSV